MKPKVQLHAISVPAALTVSGWDEPLRHISTKQPPQLFAGMFLAGGRAEGAHHGARHTSVLAHGGDGSMGMEGVAGQWQPWLRLAEDAPMESKKLEAGSVSPPHAMGCPGHCAKYVKH